jgi:hypothetical protein
MDLVRSHLRSILVKCIRSRIAAVVYISAALRMSATIFDIQQTGQKGDVKTSCYDCVVSEYKNEGEVNLIHFPSQSF